MLIIGIMPTSPLIWSLILGVYLFPILGPLTFIIFKYFLNKKFKQTSLYLKYFNYTFVKYFYYFFSFVLIYIILTVSITYIGWYFDR
jgi:hypothetical protein